MECDDCEDIDEKFVCVECIKDEAAQELAMNLNVQRKCNYCGNIKNVISISMLSKKIKRVIELFYEPSPYNDMAFSKEAIEEKIPEAIGRGDNICELILQYVGCDYKIVEDIRMCLQSMHTQLDERNSIISFTEDSYFIESNRFHQNSQKMWEDLETSLYAKERFFNSEVREILEMVFGEIGKQDFVGTDKAFDLVGPDCDTKCIYRARPFHSDADLLDSLKCPDRELGPPPASIAKSGRVNPSGISVFYGAYNPDVAIAETRPPVGSQVLVGQFNFKKNLTLLNLNSLKKLYVRESIFDPNFENLVQKVYFLSYVCDLFAKPVMPNDEVKSYLITQIISEYLNSLEHPVIDGIVYPSVQYGNDELNIALFHKSSGCELSMDICNFDVETELNHKDIYHEEIDIILNKNTNIDNTNIDNKKNSITSLSLDINSLEVYKIKHIKCVKEKKYVNLIDNSAIDKIDPITVF